MSVDREGFKRHSEQQHLMQRAMGAPLLTFQWRWKVSKAELLKDRPDSTLLV